jgi:predicted CXXCH cytochrome family protein
MDSTRAQTTGLPSPARIPRRNRASAVLQLLAVACMGLLGPRVVDADIADTKHNLSSLRFDAKTVSGETRRLRLEREVCIFCHTPSLTEDAITGAHAGTGDAVTPLWQKRGPAVKEFGFFDDIGRAGTPGATAVGSVSVACLSCHDHVQAYGMSAQLTDAEIAAGQLMVSSDHPYGIPYRGFYDKDVVRQLREDLKANPDAMSPMKLGRYIREDSQFRPVQSAVINQRRVWWATYDGVTGQRTKSDLPLYPRSPIDDDVAIPFVECTSCHDPHVDREVFLRTPNTQGRLCMTCHIK